MFTNVKSNKIMGSKPRHLRIFGFIISFHNLWTKACDFNQLFMLPVLGLA